MSAINLPSCLYYVDTNNDTVTSLLSDEYSYYLATKICGIYDSLSTYHIANQELTSRVLTLENAIGNISTSNTSDILVRTQCASYTTPNVMLPIDEAFFNFEKSFCNLSSTLGSSAELATAASKQLLNLTNLPQLTQPTYFMKNIPGWNETTYNVAGSLSNLWLTVNDIRTRFQTYLNELPSAVCVLATAENLKVLTVASYYSTITWTKHTLTGIQDPIGYKIQVFNTSDTTYATPLYSATVSATTLEHNITSENLSFDTIYKVRVIAVYSCGESLPIYVDSALMKLDIIFKAVISHEILSPVSLTCTPTTGSPVTYDAERKKLVVTLKNIATNLDAVNATGSNIQVKVRFALEGCNIDGVGYEDVIVLVPNGASTGEYSYVSSAKTNCFDGSCGNRTKSINCGISISSGDTEFDDTTLAICV